MKKGRKQEGKSKLPECLYVVFDENWDISFASHDPHEILNDIGEKEYICLVYRLDGTVKLRCNVVVEDV